MSISKNNRIVLLSKSTILHNSFGGLETHLENMAQGFKKLGYEVLVRSTYCEGKGANEVIDGITYEFAPNSKNGFYYRGYLDIIPQKINSGSYSTSFFKFVYEKSLKDEPGILYISESIAHLSMSFTNSNFKILEINHGSLISELRTIWSTIKTLKQAVSFVLKYIPYAFFRFITTDLWISRKASKIISVSSKVASEIATSTFIAQDRINVVYNGVDEDKFNLKKLDEEKIRAFYSLPKDKRIIFSIGRVIEEKGYQFVIEALPYLDSDIIFVLAGEGEYLAQLQSPANDLHVSDRFFALGKVDNKNTPELYNISEIFIIPSSRIEGFPMTTIEALNCGLKVVASPRASFEEILERKHCGVIFDHFNPTEIAAKINKCLELKVTKSDIAGFAKENFSSIAMCKSYLKLMDF